MKTAKLTPVQMSNALAMNNVEAAAINEALGLSADTTAAMQTQVQKTQISPSQICSK